MVGEVARGFGVHEHGLESQLCCAVWPRVSPWKSLSSSSVLLGRENSLPRRIPASIRWGSRFENTPQPQANGSCNSYCSVIKPDAQRLWKLVDSVVVSFFWETLSCSVVGLPECALWLWSQAWTEAGSERRMRGGEGQNRPDRVITGSLPSFFKFYYILSSLLDPCYAGFFLWLWKLDWGMGKWTVLFLSGSPLFWG